MNCRKKRKLKWDKARPNSTNSIRQTILFSHRGPLLPTLVGARQGLEETTNTFYWVNFLLVTVKSLSWKQTSFGHKMSVLSWRGLQRASTQALSCPTHDALSSSHPGHTHLTINSTFLCFCCTPFLLKKVTHILEKFSAHATIVHTLHLLILICIATQPMSDGHAHLFLSDTGHCSTQGPEL